MRAIITTLALACILATAACANQQESQQGGTGSSGGSPNAGYANDKAGGGNTGAPGRSQPAGN